MPLHYWCAALPWRCNAEQAFQSKRLGPKSSPGGGIPAALACGALAWGPVASKCPSQSGGVPFKQWVVCRGARARLPRRNGRFARGPAGGVEQVKLHAPTAAAPQGHPARPPIQSCRTQIIAIPVKGARTRPSALRALSLAACEFDFWAAANSQRRRGHMKARAQFRQPPTMKPGLLYGW